MTTRLVYGERQKDRNCGEEDCLGNAGRSERDGHEPGVIRGLLQIPGHREVRAGIKEGQRQRCEAVKWGLFVSNVPLMTPWVTQSSQYSPFAPTLNNVFLRAGQFSEMISYRLYSPDPPSCIYWGLLHRLEVSAAIPDRG